MRCSSRQVVVRSRRQARQINALRSGNKPGARPSPWGGGGGIGPKLHQVANCARRGPHLHHLQVQKLKVDTASAMLEMDQILKVLFEAAAELVSSAV